MNNVSVAFSGDSDRVQELRLCLACGSPRLERYIDFGLQPLANDYHDGSVELARFPLATNVCLDCYHSQLSHAVDPDLLYRNYLYVSGTTTTLMKSFEEFVDRVEDQFPDRSLRVLDIASNDGSLLKVFRSRGHEVLGVDPAENLRELSAANKIHTIVAYWNEETAASLDREFDVIVAMNVLAHLPYPVQFLTACRQVLAPGGRIFIQTSQCEMVERREFDTIYHEHHSFFTANSFRHLVARAGLEFCYGAKLPIHGTSYLWCLGIDDAFDDGSTQTIWDYEKKHGYYDHATYLKFGQAVHETLSFLSETVRLYASRGYGVIGYGAAAKGNTVLNAANLALDYVVDDNPLKVGLFLPGGHTEIVATERLAAAREPLCVVVLAWNFYDEIRQRVAERRQRVDDVFVRYFPDPIICHE